MPPESTAPVSAPVAIAPTTAALAPSHAAPLHPGLLVLIGALAVVGAITAVGYFLLLVPQAAPESAVLPDTDAASPVAVTPEPTLGGSVYSDVSAAGNPLNDAPGTVNPFDTGSAATNPFAAQ